MSSFSKYKAAHYRTHLFPCKKYPDAHDWQLVIVVHEVHYDGQFVQVLSDEPWFAMEYVPVGQSV